MTDAVPPAGPPTSLPPTRQSVITALTDAIMEGEYAPGSRLPSERDLAERKDGPTPPESFGSPAVAALPPTS